MSEYNSNEDSDTADNQAYLAPCLRHFTQIPRFAWTSDTLESLYEMAG